MTDNFPPAAGPPPARPDQPRAADVVKDQASGLAQSGAAAGQHAAGVARDQAAEVAAEAGRQGRGLVRDAQGQLAQQAAAAQQRLAARLRALGDELASMAGPGAQRGAAATVAGQAASRARSAGQWLEDREPSEVLDDVQAFARRRPGAFLAVALGAGLAAGRLTRGLAAAHGDDGDGALVPAAPRQGSPAPGGGPLDAGGAFPAGAAGYAAGEVPDRATLRRPVPEAPGSDRGAR